MSIADSAEIAAFPELQPPQLVVWRNRAGAFGWAYSERGYYASSSQASVWSALKQGAATGQLAQFRRQTERPISHRHAAAETAVAFCRHCGDAITARQREHDLCEACQEEFDEQREREDRERADEDYATTRRYYGS